VKHYILDGHNIIYKNSSNQPRSTSGRAQACNGLIMRCQGLIAGTTNKCTVFFDGHPPGEIATGIKNVQVTFSYDREADTIIKSFIERSKNPRNLIVVSDDTEIKNFARVHSCTILSVAAFLKKINESGKTVDSEKPSVDDLSIHEWLKIFNKK